MSCEEVRERESERGGERAGRRERTREREREILGGHYSVTEPKKKRLPPETNLCLGSGGV